MAAVRVMSTEPLATVKAKFSEYVTSVHDTHERVLVTRNGEPIAVLISPDDLESIEGTPAILSDPETMAAIREGEEAVARGDFVSGADLRAALARHPTTG